ncbi:MAG TPA: hypothetical protein VGI19_15955 [Candidatus Cybelea sp.]
MHHPLRFIIPPLIVLLAIAVVYVPRHRHEVAVRTNPHHNARKPINRATGRAILAGGLIVAFFSAFILP